MGYYQPLKLETKEQYLKIWANFAIGHIGQEELASLFGCSQDTIANAIKWVALHRIQFTTPVFAEAAKTAIEARLKELRGDLARIRGSDAVNWNWVIGLTKLIQEDEQLLWGMQGLIQRPIVFNTALFDQRFDFKIMNDLEESRREQKIIADEVNDWTVEQKKLMNVVFKAIDSGAKIEISENNNITSIQLSKDLDSDAGESSI